MSILKCKYCEKTMTVEEGTTVLLLTAANSKDGNEICRKFGHSFVINKKDDEEKK